MATITVSSSIDVSNKYESLVQQSLGGNSAYIRAKETIEELVSSGAIDEAQKAEIIGSIVGGIINNITSSSMSTAIEWAKVEKEIELEKLKLAWQLDTLEQESLLKTEQVAQIASATRLAQAESKRLYGVGVYDVAGNIVSLADEGKVFSEIALTQANTSKTAKEELLVDQKTKESYAAVHKIIADTYVNFGTYTYTGLAANGVSGVTPGHGAFVTLSDTQQSIAEEQAKGYTYNAWANALTGSASMLGTAIAAEYAEFGPGTTGGELLDIVKLTATNLKNTSAASNSVSNFFFTPITGVALSTVSTSNAVYISGVQGAYLISVIGGTYSINGGAYTAVAGAVFDGDIVTVRQTSSDTNSTSTTAYVTIAGLTSSFVVTTLPAA